MGASGVRRHGRPLQRDAPPPCRARGQGSDPSISVSIIDKQTLTPVVTGQFLILLTQGPGGTFFLFGLIHGNASSLFLLRVLLLGREPLFYSKGNALFEAGISIFSPGSSSQ